MSPPTKGNAPDRGSRALTSSGGKPKATLKSNSPAGRPRQIDRVRKMLLDGWVCSTGFLAVYLPRHSPRIHELRKAGYLIERRLCESHDWHESTQYEWTIVAVPYYPEGEPCPVCGSRLSHTSDCQYQALAETQGSLFGGGS